MVRLLLTLRPMPRRLAAAGAVCLMAALLSAGRDELRAQSRALVISQIQGDGPRSRYEGVTVTTTGVVTGRKSNGLFIQTPAGADDGNPATSEGLFVFTGTAPAALLTAGTVVEVSGRVIEFVPAADPSSPPLTELVEPTFAVRGAGLSLPAPIEIGPGTATASPSGIHPLERLEGMRVRVASLATVSGTLGSVNEANATGTSNGVFYGVVAGAPRPFREPGIVADAPLPADAPCCVPRYAPPFGLLRVDSDGQPGAPALNLATDARVQQLVGPLDFGFRAYTILPDLSSPPQVVPAPDLPLIREAGADEFAVASFNLQRFFDTTDDPGVGDAVLTAAAYETRLRKASLYVRRLMRLPHIIGVQEVENLATLQALAARLNRDAREARELKTRYEAYLEEGNDPGGIDVGLLVDRARVEVLQVVQEGRGEQFRAPSGQLDVVHDRPPLIMQARVTWPAVSSRPLTVVVAHMRSLIDIDSPTSGARVRAKRAAQAESLALMVDRRLSSDTAAPLVVIGDMNAFEFSDGYVDVVGTVGGHPAPREQVVQPTRDLLTPDLINLVDGVPAADRYSYVFDGVAQTLDHMLVSPGLLPAVTGFGHVRGNADAPEVWRSDATRPERISDHDPALVYLRVR